MPKTVGILGGMGPKSTVELMYKIVEATPAKKDQQHIRMLVDNRPEIPDRTDFILGTGSSPLPMMQESVQLLEKWGAEMIAIACNTAHYFLDDLQQVVGIPVLNMIELVSHHIARSYGQGEPVLLLATSGSVKTGLYEKFVREFELIVPNEQVQEELVMAGIRGVKANEAHALSQRKFLDAVERSSARKPVCVIAGCTEIGLALQDADLNIPLINPLAILAQHIVERAFA